MCSGGVSTLTSCIRGTEEEAGLFIMAATTEQKVIEIRKDDKNVAVVNLHGKCD